MLIIMSGVFMNEKDYKMASWFFQMKEDFIKFVEYDSYIIRI